MNNMVPDGCKASVIVPASLEPRMLRVDWRVTQPAWHELTPINGLFPLEFNQGWDYNKFIYIDMDEEKLQHYRFIGMEQDEDTLSIERIVRADWLAAHRDECSLYRNYAKSAYRVTLGADRPIFHRVSSTETPPVYPEDLYDMEKTDWEVSEGDKIPKPFRPFVVEHGYRKRGRFGRRRSVPAVLDDKLLPVFDVCSGSTLPADFYQLSTSWNGDEHCYLYIDLEDADLKDWLLLGNYASDPTRGGAQFLDVQDIEKVPPAWGEAIAYEMYREPTTGYLAVRKYKPASDELIRGQVVVATKDIKNEGWDKEHDSPHWREFYVRVGDTLIIDKCSGEKDMYRCYLKVPTSSTNSTGMELLWEDIPRDAMRVVEGQREKLPSNWY